MIYQVKGISGHGCGSVQKGGCAGVHGCAWVCACVWNEFSEFLLENRVPTSADFNTYPIRIFLTKDTSISDLKQFDRV